MENKDLNCSAEALFLNAAKLIKPTGILYVGAYEGEGIELFKESNCPVHAFEPNPNHWPKIKNKYNLHQVEGQLWPIGIANFIGEINLKIHDGDGIASSFLSTKIIKQMFPQICLDHTVKSKVETLDNLIENKIIPKCNYLILDIQGLELNALLGAYNTAKNDVDVIITEYSSYELYSSQNLIKDLDALLKELGFFAKSNLKHIHADAIYIKDKWRDKFEKLPNITHPIVSEDRKDCTQINFGYNSEWIF